MKKHLPSTKTFIDKNYKKKLWATMKTTGHEERLNSQIVMIKTVRHNQELGSLYVMMKNKNGKTCWL